jgi:hypothetical protein
MVLLSFISVILVPLVSDIHGDHMDEEETVDSAKLLPPKRLWEIYHHLSNGGRASGFELAFDKYGQMGIGLVVDGKVGHVITLPDEPMEND